MTDFACPKPPVVCVEIELSARASSARNSGRARPSRPAPPTRSSSRRVTPSQSRPSLPGIESIFHLLLNQTPLPEYTERVRQRYLPEPVYIDPETFDHGAAVDAVCFNRNDRIDAVRLQ